MVDQIVLISLAISLVSLLISLILGIVKIIEVNNNWKKSKINLSAFIVNGKLEIDKGEKSALLNVFISISNTGNQDTFIESINITNYEGNRFTLRSLDGEFKISANQKKDFFEELKIKYNPTFIDKLKEEKDMIKIEIRDKNKKKKRIIIYYSFNENNKLVTTWFD